MGKRQKLRDGYGPVHHRVYAIQLHVSYERACQMMRELQADPNVFSPQMLAKFEKTRGAPGQLRDGDEFLIHITGPWDGPVRVADVKPDEFRLVTLEGHLEAGEIKFEIKREGQTSVFVIESLARSKDGVVDFVYDKIPIAKAAQTEMWSQFCTTFAQKAQGTEQVAEVGILTERQDEESGEWKKI